MKKRILFLSLVMAFVFISINTQLISTSANFDEPKNDLSDIPDFCQQNQSCRYDISKNYENDLITSLNSSILDTKSPIGINYFGYMWNEEADYVWFDAKTGGIDVGISQTTSNVGPISLPFNFPFFENTYNEFYISQYGYITFNNEYFRSYAEIPKIDLVNDIIAGFWAGLEPGSSGSVYYYVEGTSPNQIAVIEWNQFTYWLGGEYSFQILLFENGNIKFQYKTMNQGQGYPCNPEIGIENSFGTDGIIRQSNFCNDYPEPETSILLTRPDPSAFVQISPVWNENFSNSVEVNEFEFTISNKGALGEDSFDLSVTSDWPSFKIFRKSDNTEITNTEILQENASIDLILRGPTPLDKSIGDKNTIHVTALSTKDNTKLNTATFELIIPVPFAHTHAERNIDGDDSTLILEQVWSEYQSKTQQTTLNFSSDVVVSPVIEEIDEKKFILIWGGEGNELEPTITALLKYIIVDHFGNQILSEKIITTKPINDPNVFIRDFDPSVSVTKDGFIGITWQRILFNKNTNLQNYNQWFMVLDQTGQVVQEPTNLTKNISWNNILDIGIISYSNGEISAIDDGKFIIVWEINEKISSSSYLTELEFIIINSSGTIIKPINKIGSNFDENISFVAPTISCFLDNRIIIIFQKLIKEEDLPFTLTNNYFRILDTDGNLIQEDIEIFDVHPLPPNSLQSIQLGNGNFIIVGSGGLDTIRVNVYDQNSYEILNSIILSHPKMSGSNLGISLTNDDAGNAIITWSDQFGKSLFYSLINYEGVLINNPIIFKTSPTNKVFDLAYSGGSLTRNSWRPTNAIDGIIQTSTTNYNSNLNNTVSIEFILGNQGLERIENSNLVLSLDDGLTYVGDNSGLDLLSIDQKRTKNSDLITWNIANLRFLDNYKFTVDVLLPSDFSYGSEFNYQLSYNIDGQDIDLENNLINGQIKLFSNIFLPLISR